MNIKTIPSVPAPGTLGFVFPSIPSIRPLNLHDVLHLDHAAVVEGDGLGDRVMLSDKAGHGFVGAAGFFCVRDEEGEGGAAGRRLAEKGGEAGVEIGADVLGDVDRGVREARGFRDQVVVADQRGKWRKLRSAGQPGHGRVALGHGMLQVDDVAVLFAGVAHGGSPFFLFGK